MTKLDKIQDISEQIRELIKSLPAELQSFTMMAELAQLSVDMIAARQKMIEMVVDPQSNLEKNKEELLALLNPEIIDEDSEFVENASDMIDEMESSLSVESKAHGKRVDDMLITWDQQAPAA